MGSPNTSHRHRFNAVPALITLSTGPLVLIVQQCLRPALTTEPWLIRSFLEVAPNLITGFCFPYAVLMRPTLMSQAQGKIAFAAACWATLLILLAFEWWRPIAGATTFDFGDVAASFVGTGLSYISYRVWVRKWLRFQC